MKKVLSLLLGGVLVAGIVMLYAPGASALRIVGDPIEGNSFSLRFQFEINDGPINYFEFTHIDDGQFSSPGLTLFEMPSWTTSGFNPHHVSAGGGIAAIAFLFRVTFAGDLDQTFRAVIRARYNHGWTKNWCFKFREGRSSVSVPDADIMWLLGPALIALGLIGRRKHGAVRS